MDYLTYERKKPFFPDWLRKTLDEINTIQNLPENWDSDNSPAPHKKICSQLKNLLIYNRGFELPTPFITPMSNGGIYIRLIYDNRELMIEFDDPSGVYASCLWVKKVLHGEDAYARRVPIYQRNFDLLLKWLMGQQEALSLHEESPLSFKHTLNRSTEKIDEKSPTVPSREFEMPAC